MSKLSTVQDNFLKHKLQQLRSLGKDIPSTVLRYRGVQSTKYFCDGLHIATIEVPKVGKPRYLLNTNLVNNLLEAP